jgi:hypothetical protein
MDILAEDLRVDGVEEADELLVAMARFMLRPIRVPSRTLRAANRVVVPWRFVIMSHSTGAACALSASPGGCDREPGLGLFSSSERTTAWAGGST